MKQTRALYCLTLGFLHGARLDKTYNYDAVNEGYSLNKPPFTPITFVKQCDINQPIHHSGQTYLFGFSPQDLFRIASLTKKDLEDALVVERNWVDNTQKKIRSGWEKVAASVATETQIAEKEKNLQPTPPAAMKASSVAPATPPMVAQEETTPEPPQPVPEASKPAQEAVSEPEAPAPSTPAEAPPEEKQETGTVARGVLAYNVYVASAKSTAPGSLSIGYSAIVKNLQTGEITEFGKGGYTNEFGKMIVLALREAFEGGVIPPSTKTTSVLTTVYSSNKYIVSMFAKNYLRNFSKNEWKKKDGTVIQHQDEWERVWNQVSHMMSKGILCESDGEDLKVCTERAQKFAEADNEKRYGLIGPDSEKK